MKNQGVLDLFGKVDHFVLDVDGVLTDGGLYLVEGFFTRKMNTKDGFALIKAIQKGYMVSVITGGRNPLVAERLKSLGVQDVYLSCDDKKEALEELINIYDKDPQHMLYMGDDLPDYPAMQMVGLPTCPNDAVQDIKDTCKYISPIEGGRGCVRDVIEKTLKIRGDWEVIE